MQTRRLWPSLYAVACLAILAPACGKKDKKHGDSAGPAPVVSVDKEIGADGTMFRYEATIAGSKFKCMVEEDGRAGQWQDCPADGMSVPTRAGVRYVFKVKAIGPDGQESPIKTIPFVGRGGDENTNEFQLATQILNKAE